MKKMKRLIPVFLLLFLSSSVYADDFQDFQDLLDISEAWYAYDQKDYKTAFEKLMQCFQQIVELLPQAWLKHRTPT